MTPRIMEESKKKARQEFQRKIFVLQSSLNSLQELFAKVHGEMNKLWILNDKILEEDKE